MSLFSLPKTESENYVNPLDFTDSSTFGSEPSIILDESSINIDPKKEFPFFDLKEGDNSFSFTRPSNLDDLRLGDTVLRNPSLESEEIGFGDTILRNPSLESEEIGFGETINRSPSEKDLSAGTGSLDTEISQIDSNEAEFSMTKYKGRKGSEKALRFYFSMLPSIRTDNMEGVSFNMNDTPGATEGISILTQMRYKNRPTPGGHPIVDGIGIDNKVLRLVGAFTGWDKFDQEADTISTPSREDSSPPNNHSYTIAKTFNKDVVEKGGVIKVNVQDRNLDISLYCVIMNFQIYVVREELTYYQIDCLVTDYT